MLNAPAPGPLSAAERRRRERRAARWFSGFAVVALLGAMFCTFAPVFGAGMTASNVEHLCNLVREKPRFSDPHAGNGAMCQHARAAGQFGELAWLGAVGFAIAAAVLWTRNRSVASIIAPPQEP